MMFPFEGRANHVVGPSFCPEGTMGRGLLHTSRSLRGRERPLSRLRWDRWVAPLWITGFCLAGSYSPIYSLRLGLTLYSDLRRAHGFLCDRPDRGCLDQALLDLELLEQLLGHSLLGLLPGLDLFNSFAREI